MQTLQVFPTSRAIRQRYISVDENALLPDFVTMGDFIQRICITDGYKMIDDDMRVLLLLEASRFKNFSSLKIERNFFTFLKNSSYIFSFFEELSGELCDIDTISKADVYAEFEEHIQILKTLYNNYKELCLKKKLLDKIFLPELYKLNQGYLKRYDKIVLHVEGYLSNFEFALLNECCKFCEIELKIITTKFNKKLREKFSKIDITLESGYDYLISLNQKKVLKSTKVNHKANITCEAFGESLLQVAFIKHKVYEAINKGYAPKDIAVILPDESMAQKIRDFDIKTNFNFAMGWSFAKSAIYKKIKANMDFIEQKNKQNEARVKRVGKIDMANKELIPLLYELLDEIKIEAEKKIYIDELYRFEKLLELTGDINFKNALNLFMQRLSKRSIDDVLGGEITVMGLLESRSVYFDVVIIVDFNEGKVPKKSTKDMFLNTKVRAFANLPTTKDRQNLQKHYYELLFLRAKEVYISYIDSEVDMPSRFLQQLGIKTSKTYKDDEYAKILFTKHTPPPYKQDEIVLPYSFKDKVISASSLKTYLACKRKYYYKYIQKIQEHQTPQDMPQEFEVGNVVHGALKNLYDKKSSYHSVDELKKALHAEMDRFKSQNNFMDYLIDMQKQLLEPFCEMEVKRFDDGWSVYGCEVELSGELADAKLYGKIDRIDKKDNNFCVLDYKTGSYTIYNKNNYLQAIDFQLEIYNFLVSQKGMVEMCGFYDLKKAKIVQESFLHEKTELLKELLKDMITSKDIEFSKCDDIKHCRFCPYTYLCDR